MAKEQATDPVETGPLKDFSDAQIMEMPLHALSQVLGEEGLRHRFDLEITEFSPEEQAQLNKALLWASDLHAEDHRYKEPAINHMLRIALRILHHYEAKDVNLLTAALLHDSVEDHTPEITGDKKAMPKDALKILTEEFNPDVASLVEAVTNPEYEDGKDRLEQYQQHVREILKHADPRAKILKLSDFTDNATGLLFYTPAEGAIYRANRYRPLVPEFETAVMEPSMPLSPEVKAYVVKQLDQTGRRLDILLKSDAMNKE